MNYIRGTNTTPVSLEVLLELIPYELPCHILYLQRSSAVTEAVQHSMSLKI